MSRVRDQLTRCALARAESGHTAHPEDFDVHDATFAYPDPTTLDPRHPRRPEGSGRSYTLDREEPEKCRLNVVFGRAKAAADKIFAYLDRNFRGSCLNGVSIIS